ncbi:MAG: ATP-dependent nuclease [Candidatus Coprovivens sp.]
MYNLKIKSIKLNNGQVLLPNKINIIVGPNNSGKSRFLKDLRNYFMGNDNSNVIIKEVCFDFPNNSDDFISSYKIDKRIVSSNGNCFLKNYSGLCESINNGRTIDDSLNNNNNYCFSNDWKSQLKENILILNQNDIDVNNDWISNMKNDFIKMYGSLFYQYLGTEERLLMCKKQARHGFDSYSSNLLSEFSNRPEIMKELSNIVYQLFGKYIYLDQVCLSNSIGIRVSDDFDFYNNINIDDNNSKEILNKYSFLDEEGDGLKNFICTYLSIKSELKNVLMIDEPESFLHPPLALRFGEILSSSLSENQQLFVVTHNDNIIKGILSKVSGSYVNIIRFDRNNYSNYMNVITKNDITNLKRKPIILMSNILNGLFSEKVYVTESFSDSAIYQNILMKYNSEANFYFVNTQGKDKISSVLDFYDKLGVKSIGVYDFDFFRDPETVKKAIKNRLNNEEKYNKITSFFSDVRKYLTDLSKLNLIRENYENYDEYKRQIKINKDEFYHKYGIKSILDKSLYNQLILTFDELKKYNIYIIKSGELETILFNIGVEYSNNKDNWLNMALEKIEKIKKCDIEKLDFLDMFDI